MSLAASLLSLVRPVIAPALLAVLAVGSSAAGAQAGDRLFAQGAQIRWGTGASSVVVKLRGVSFVDPLQRRGWNRTPDDNDYGRAAGAWNANVVRIPIQSADFGDPARKAAVKAAAVAEVGQALAATPGLFVIVDWHTIGWPDDSACDPGHVCTRALAEEFWAWAAGQWGANGRVAFELWNEPRSADAYSPGAPHRWPELKGHLDVLVGVVRGAGARNLVLAAGNRNASRLEGVKADPLADDNVAYAWHVYPEAWLPSPDGGAFNAAAWDRRLDGLNLTRPVVVTEWGYCQGSHDPAGCAGFHAEATKESYGAPLHDRYLRPSTTVLPSPLGHVAWLWVPQWPMAMLLEEPYWGDATPFGDFVKQRLNLTRQTRP